MNFVTVAKLMLRPDLWEPGWRLFPDELCLKDGDLRFYSDQAVCFRRVSDGMVVYTVPVLAWIWILPLAHWLHRRVMRRHNDGLSGGAAEGGHVRLKP